MVVFSCALNVISRVTLQSADDVMYLDIRLLNTFYCRFQVYQIMRCYSTQSAASENSSEVVKMSVSSQLRAMSVNQWKLLSQLKDYINRSNDKNSFFVFNKEWISLLHKISSVSSKDDANSSNNVSKVQNDTNNVKVNVVPKIEESSKTNQSSLPNVLSELKLKINNKVSSDASQEVVAKWKPKKDAVSLTSIRSRTRHVIAAVASAESSSSKLKRLESLTSHLHQYPESRYLAVKEGAVRLLLRLREAGEGAAEAGAAEAGAGEVAAAARAGLAALGHVDPLPGRGVRILAIDGGGIRGLLVLEMLKHLEKLTGKRVYELFDFICGVSTGAIMMGVIASEKRSLEEASRLYKEMSKKIFTQSAFWGASSLVWSHSYYSTEMWEQLLRAHVGEAPMAHMARDPLMPKLACVSAVVNAARVCPFVFRSYALPVKACSQYEGSSRHRMWEAARASAAAPSYFEEFRLGDFLHQDGGILTNNPSAVAIHEARHLWPGERLQCVVSLGTGRTHPKALPPAPAAASSWKAKFMRILDSATDTEAVHTTLNDLLPRDVYYRFNPYITEMVTMDEIRPEKISQLEMDAAMYCRRNEDAFQEVACALTAEAGLARRARDWLALRRQLLGLP